MTRYHVSPVVSRLHVWLAAGRDPDRRRQLTPRIIATTLLRNNVVRYSVGVFVFTLVFGVQALNRSDNSVQHLVAVMAAILGVACIAISCS